MGHLRWLGNSGPRLHRYLFTTQQLTFAEGELSKTVSVRILDDLAYRGERTLRLVLQGHSSVLSSSSSALITIADNDMPPEAGELRFSGTGYSVQENAASVAVTVARVNGSDGENSHNLSVSILDDSRDETSEQCWHCLLIFFLKNN